jgi:hypothetical protein
MTTEPTAAEQYAAHAPQIRQALGLNSTALCPLGDGTAIHYWEGGWWHGTDTRERAMLPTLAAAALDSALTRELWERFRVDVGMERLPSSCDYRVLRLNGVRCWEWLGKEGWVGGIDDMVEFPTCAAAICAVVDVLAKEMDAEKPVNSPPTPADPVVEPWMMDAAQAPYGPHDMSASLALARIIARCYAGRREQGA